MQGPPPPEANQAMKHLKWSVLAMIGTAAGRLIFALWQGLIGSDLMGILNIVLSVVLAAWVMKDDPHLSPVYQCLAKGPCQNCAEQGLGGMGCLMPFLVVTATNAFFDILFRLTWVVVMPYGFFLAGCMAAEVASAYSAYIVYKVVQDLAPPDGTELGYGGGGFFQSGGEQRASLTAAPGTSPQQAFGEQTAQASSGQANNLSFVPFQGSGQRLGG